MRIHSSSAATLALVSALALPGLAWAQAGTFTGGVGVIYVQPHVDSPVLGAHVSNDTQPVLDLNYYFTNHIALATQLALPRHEVSVGGVSLGKVTLAPFNLVLQYHFMPEQKFSPYLGAGINYTLFFDQGGTLSNFERFGPSTGGVLQAGADYNLNQKDFINFDVKKWYIETDITPKGGAKIETMKLDPVTLSVAFGMHF